MSRLTKDIHKCLTDEILSKLFQRRIKTTLQFMESESEFLASFSGLQFRQILSVKDNILSKFASKMRTGDRYYSDVLKRSAILPSGIQSLDNLLEGGLYTGCVYEFCGTSSSGKSQICMSTAANIVSRNKQVNVLYIDTKGDLSAERLLSNMENVNEPGHALSQILVCQPKNAYQLISTLHDHIGNIGEKNIRLIIIDSLAAVFYQLIGDHQESTSLLSNVSSLLKYIASELHSVVIVTNLSTTWQNVESDDVQKASLGKYWEHIPATRFTVSRLTSSQILLTVTKSSNLSIGSSITLSILEKGVS